MFAALLRNRSSTVGICVLLLLLLLLVGYFTQSPIPVVIASAPAAVGLLVLMWGDAAE